MIAAAFAAAGEEVARAWLARLMGPLGGEILTNGRGAIGVRSRAFVRTTPDRSFVEESVEPWRDDHMGAEVVASRGLTCGIGIADDGLLLARGRFGGRALFFAVREEGRVLLASSVFGALVDVCRPLTLRPEKVASLLALLPEARETGTLYREIERVRSAHIIHLSRSGRVDRLVKRPALPMLEGTVEELALELRRAIFDAVARSIAGSKRIAIAISGGLDSSGLLIAALAQARGAGVKTIDALTMAFADPGDDRPYVRTLCDDLGIVPIVVDPHTCGSRARNALVMDGAPCPSPTAAWVEDLMARASALGADRLLTGDGGDVVFEGDLSTLASRADLGEWLGAARSAMRMNLPNAGSRLARTIELVGRPVLRRRMPLPFRVRWRARAFDKRVPWAGRALRTWAHRTLRHGLEVESESYGTRSDASWLEGAGASRLLDYADARSQLEIGVGSPWYSPYFDASLIDFVRRISPATLLHGGWSRGLYREAFRGTLLPAVLFRRTKSGVTEAVREIVRGAGGLGAFSGEMAGRRLERLDLISPPTLRSNLARGMTTGIPNWTALWAPLAAEAFLGGSAA